MHYVGKIGIIGAGQMGRGIAQVASQSGFETLLFDSSSESLERGSTFIKEQLSRGVSKGKWTEKASQKAQESLRLETSLEGLSDCDLVIEAATERKDIKFKIFQECDRVIKEALKRF